MSEEKKVEEDEQSSEEDEEKQSLTMIDKLKAATAESRAANKERLDILKKESELMARQEKLQVEKTLGGQAEVTDAKKVETPQEYTKRVMAGEFNVEKN